MTIHSRFTKDDINNKGFKIGYFDTSVLSSLQKLSADCIDNLLRQNNIRPTIDKFVLAEWLQGLERPELAEDKKNQFTQEMEKVIGALGKLDLLWFIERYYVLAIEYLQIKNDHSLAHKYYKVFADRPVDRPKDKEYSSLLREKQIEKEDTYRCDKGLKYVLRPYKSVAVKDKIDWIAFFNEFIGQRLAQPLQEGATKIVNENNKSSENIKKSESIDVTEEFKKAHLHRIEKVLQNRTTLEHKEIRDISDYMNNELSADKYPTQFLKRAPLDVVYRHFDKKNGLEGLGKKKKGKDVGQNNLLDSLHATLAISYCDYLITNDQNLQKLSLKIIEQYKFETKILQFNCKDKTLEEVTLKN